MQNFLDSLLCHLEKPDDKILSTLKSHLKLLYDELKCLENRQILLQKSSQVISSTCLPELIVKNLDEEQIWQQLDIQNDEKLGKFKRALAKCPDTNLNRLLERRKSEKKPDEPLSDEKAVDSIQNSEEEAIEKDGESDKNDKNSDSDDADLADKTDEKDKFFNEKEMEDFLEQEDKKAMGEIQDVQEDDSDMMDDEENSDNEDIDGSKNLRYDDFFGRKSKQKITKKVRFDNEPEDLSESDREKSADDDVEPSDDIEENDDPKSTFEIRQEKLHKKIESIEKEHLASKPWQQIGEVTAKSRPENSLLEEYVEFEHTTKPPPAVTQETTLKLEDVIKQRIKDKAWDDVERKVKPMHESHAYKNELILDQQKSKLSLSQVYEKEYLKLQQHEKEETENSQHTEIRRLMKELFVKLDALTNYHYTPSLPVNEIKIVANTKAISVEEVAPVTVNDATLLAPEEIKTKAKSLAKSTDERSKTDKLRDLRRKKKLAKIKAKRSEERDRKAKVPKDKLKMLQKLGKICKVEGPKTKNSKARKDKTPKLKQK